MGYQSVFTKSITGATQGDGEQVIDVSGSYEGIEENKVRNPRFLALTNWQLQFIVSGSPTAGTATISVKSPGASGFADLSTTVDLIKGPLLVSFEALAEEIKVTPDSFDGDSFDVVLIAS